MFGAVISQIGNSGRPIVTELTLIILETEPVEGRVHGFGEFGGNDVVCDPSSGQVFSLEVWPWLGPAHFNESLVEGVHLLGGDKEVREFQFDCGVHDKFDDLGESEE